MIFVLLEFTIAVFTGFWILGSIVHVAGAVLGVAAGLIMLKLDWVDCENWDLLAVIAGREGKPPASAEDRESDAQRTTRLEAQGVEAIQHIRGLLGMDKIEGALAVYKKMARTIPDWNLPETELLDLIKGLHRNSLWNESLPLMGEYSRTFPDRSQRMRLKLAELLIKQAARPRLALKVLAKIPAGTAGRSGTISPSSKARHDCSNPTRSPSLTRPKTGKAQGARLPVVPGL